MILRRSITMLALATLAACAERTPAGAAPEPAQALRGTYWRLTELEGRPATAGIAGREAHIRFNAAGELMGGSTGCNSVSGAYRLEGDRLRFLEPITTTRMACASAVGEQERAFIEALAASERFAITGGRLVLYGGGRALMKFEAGTPR
jgi:heat shock protein HslJ